MDQPSRNSGSTGATDRIDLNDKASCERWVRKLNVTHQQMREAVEAVGDDPAAVEMHLKGVRSTTNDERVEKALGTTDRTDRAPSDKPR